MIDFLIILYILSLLLCFFLYFAVYILFSVCLFFTFLCFQFDCIYSQMWVYFNIFTVKGYIVYKTHYSSFSHTLMCVVLYLVYPSNINRFVVQTGFITCILYILLYFLLRNNIHRLCLFLSHARVHNLFFICCYFYITNNYMFFILHVYMASSYVRYYIFSPGIT